jgi:hypothetical protein
VDAEPGSTIDLEAELASTVTRKVSYGLLAGAGLSGAAAGILAILTWSSGHDARSIYDRSTMFEISSEDAAQYRALSDRRSSEATAAEALALIAGGLGLSALILRLVD